MSIDYTPPTPDELAKENWISRAYYWFWHDVCHRPEPFTYTMRKSVKQYPALWICVPIAVGLVIAGIVVLLLVYYGKEVKKNPRLLWWLLLPAVIFIGWWLLATHLWGIL